MKRTILNIMATTGITLVVLSAVALCYDASFICISTVFQALGLNAVMYVGLFLLNKIDFRFTALESLVKVAFVIALVLVAGEIFGWYENLSVIVLTGMSLGILAICLCLDALSIKGEVKEINGLIEDLERKQRLTALP